MKTTAWFFLFSSVFSAAVAIAYGLVTREPAGTSLLTMMALAPGFVAGWLMLFQRKGVRVSGDVPDEDPDEGRGDVIGTFVERSPWPLVLAGGMVFAISGLSFGLWLGAPGLATIVIAIYGLMRESAG